MKENYTKGPPRSKRRRIQRKWRKRRYGWMPDIKVSFVDTNCIPIIEFMRRWTEAVSRGLGVPMHMLGGCAVAPSATGPIKPMVWNYSLGEICKGELGETTNGEAPSEDEEAGAEEVG